MRSTLSLALLAAAFVGCMAEDAPPHGDPEPLGETSAYLTDADPVSAAVTDSCTTASVKGLSTQLVEEIQCLRPGTMKSIEGGPGLELGAAVFPWLQTAAADAVLAAQKDRATTLAINSALRTLPQQYLLYRWYQTKRCNIGLAARPGQSNHESGLAVDIQDNASWREAMAAREMKWLGASDPVHFDFVGAGSVELGGVSVLAFQRLWNRNHPEDPIAEDSAYGDETEARLAKSPIGGFARGAECADATPAPAPTVEEPVADAAGDAGSGEGRGDGSADEGCAVTSRPGRSHGWLALALAAFVMLRRRLRPTR